MQVWMIWNASQQSSKVFWLDERFVCHMHILLGMSINLLSLKILQPKMNAFNIFVSL